MNRDLMIQVERAVRDLRALHVRKMRMRDELYSLLSDRVDDSLARGVSESEAIQQAIASFGDPGELRSELQATVPACERFSVALDRFLLGRSSVNLFLRPVSARESLRAGLLLGSILLFALLLPAAVLSWGFGNEKGFLIWKTYLVLAGVFAWNTAVMTWCGSRAVQALLAVPQWRRALLTLAGWAILAGVSLGLSDALLFLSSGWQAFAEVGWWSSLLAAPAGSAVFAVVCRLISIEMEQRQPWLELELS